MTPVVIDTYNLYHCAKSRFNKVVDYDKLFEYIKEQHGEINSNAYVARVHKSEHFIQLLRSKYGCFVSTKEIRNRKSDSFDVEITLDMLTNTTETMILCSSSLNLVPLLKRLHDLRINVHVYASGIPREFQNYCMAREIPARMMRDEPPVATK